MRGQTIAGLIAALILGSFVVVASAQVTPAPPAQDRYATVWPAISTTNGVPNTVVTEWYSDIPWTQKLGTFRGNEIDEALVLPYDATPRWRRHLFITIPVTDATCETAAEYRSTPGARLMQRSRRS
jgi:hypothetical protein